MIVEDWGIIDYKQALERQQQLVVQVAEGHEGYVIFCEHPPTLTLGRMTDKHSILFAKEMIEASGVQIYPIDRGGDVTGHEPGQLVVYVIVDLKRYQRDLKRYMQLLEEVGVDLLKEFGILAKKYQDQRGVFVHQEKVISIGVGVRKWVTYHGLGINVNNDLKVFRWIKPCGLDVSMTTMSRLLGYPVAMADVKKTLMRLIQQYMKD